MEGTLRVFDPNIRKRFIQRIQEITQNIAAAYRTKAKIEVLSDVPPMVCDKKEVDWCSDIIREVDDSLSVDQFHAMDSEDFACYSELVPTAFFMMGAGVDDPKNTCLNIIQRFVLMKKCFRSAQRSILRLY